MIREDNINTCYEQNEEKLKDNVINHYHSVNVKVKTKAYY